MKIIYEAFDGKTFETESACVSYEKEMWTNNLPANTVCFYSMDYQPLPVTVESTYDVFFVRVNEVNNKVIDFFDYLSSKTFGFVTCCAIAYSKSANIMLFNKIFNNSAFNRLLPASSFGVTPT